MARNNVNPAWDSTEFCAANDLVVCRHQNNANHARNGRREEEVASNSFQTGVEYANIGQRHARVPFAAEPVPPVVRRIATRLRIFREMTTETSENDVPGRRRMLRIVHVSRSLHIENNIAVAFLQRHGNMASNRGISSAQALRQEISWIHLFRGCLSLPT
jgi:hypothetical protein